MNNTKDIFQDSTWYNQKQSVSDTAYKKLYEGDWSQVPEYPCSNCNGLGEVLYIGRWVDCAKCEGKGYLND